MQTTHLIMEGTLEALPLPSLLQTVSGLGRPMAISVHNAESNGLVCVQDGQVLWAQSGHGTTGMPGLVTLLNTAWARFAVYRFDDRMPPQRPVGALEPLLLLILGHGAAALPPASHA